MNAIVLAALLYRATFIPVPSKLDVLYISEGWDPKYCRVTYWDLLARPQEAECDEGKRWGHFDLDPTYFAPVIW
jgi:hypothetical protein